MPPFLRYKDQLIALEEKESVLHALQRKDMQVSFSCGVGVCQSCMMQCTQGELPRRAQNGLKENLKKQGYFLACVCYPEADISICDLNDPSLHTEAIIEEMTMISASILLLRLRPLQPFSYRAGQFANLGNPQGIQRSYSLASLPSDPLLEFHIRLQPQGLMSRWLREEANPGMMLSLRNLTGECFYPEDEPDRDLLLVGTGTGLAPLWGILRDAIAHGHKGKIDLFHGALDLNGLYLSKEIQEIIKDHPNISYTRCLLQGTPAPNLLIGDLQEFVCNRLSAPKEKRAFLCGDPKLVQSLRKRLFLKGLSHQHIHVDPFIPSTQSTP
jgi:ferredoxin-NADP reductase/ferredoxin